MVARNKARSSANAAKKMKRFGDLLKRLRGPDVEEYRYKLAVDYWKKKKLRKEKGASSYKQHKKISKEDKEKEINACKYYIEFPKTFSDYQRHAVRIGVQTHSLRETAKLIGINKNTLHDYEIGKRYPPAEFVFEFCDALGLSADKLMQDWVGYHPNKNISKHAPDGIYTAEAFWQNESGYIQPSDEELIGFIQSAIRLACYLTGSNAILGERLLDMSLMTSLIMYRVISRDLPIHKNSIDTNGDNYILSFGMYKECYEDENIYNI